MFLPISAICSMSYVSLSNHKKYLQYHYQPNILSKFRLIEKPMSKICRKNLFFFPFISHDFIQLKIHSCISFCHLQ